MSEAQSYRRQKRKMIYVSWCFVLRWVIGEGERERLKYLDGKVRLIPHVLKYLLLFSIVNFALFLTFLFYYYRETHIF